MDDLIKEIMNTDIASSQIVAQAENSKRDFILNENSKRNKLYQEIKVQLLSELDSSNQDILEQTDHTNEENDLSYQHALNHLTQLFNDNKDQWIKEIVDRCKKV